MFDGQRILGHGKIGKRRNAVKHDDSIILSQDRLKEIVCLI